MFADILQVKPTSDNFQGKNCLIIQLWVQFVQSFWNRGVLELATLNPNETMMTTAPTRLNIWIFYFLFI